MSRNSNRMAQKAPPEKTEPTPQQLDQPVQTVRRTANTEFVELPSKGLFYPQNHPLHRQETVEIRFMTARDEDILTSPALLRKGVAIDKFIQNILVDQNIRVPDLLIGDKSAIMVAARVTGYGPEYEVKITCPECNTECDVTVDLTDYHKYFEKFEQSEHFTLNRDGNFDATLPMSGLQVTVKLMTSRDETRMSNRMNTKKKNKLAETNTTDFLKSIIVSVDGTSDPSDLNDMIGDMPARDSRFLRKNYAQLVPAVRLKEDFECMYCGAETETEVPLEATFFWPDI